MAGEPVSWADFQCVHQRVNLSERALLPLIGSTVTQDLRVFDKVSD